MNNLHHFDIALGAKLTKKKSPNKVDDFIF